MRFIAFVFGLLLLGAGVSPALAQDSRLEKYGKLLAEAKSIATGLPEAEEVIRTLEGATVVSGPDEAQAKPPVAGKAYLILLNKEDTQVSPWSTVVDSDTLLYQGEALICAVYLDTQLSLRIQAVQLIFGSQVVRSDEVARMGTADKEQAYLKRWEFHRQLMLRAGGDAFKQEMTKMAADFARQAKDQGQEIGSFTLQVPGEYLKSLDKGFGEARSTADQRARMSALIAAAGLQAIADGSGTETEKNRLRLKWLQSVV